jgi:hypothetical protein
MKLFITQSSPASSQFLPLRSKYSSLSTLFSDTLNLCSSRRVRNRISNTYRKQVNNVLYIPTLSIFNYQTRRREFTTTRVELWPAASYVTSSSSEQKLINLYCAIVIIGSTEYYVTSGRTCDYESEMTLLRSLSEAALLDTKPEQAMVGKRYICSCALTEHHAIKA